MIHDYFGVNLEIVWAVVENELPRLKTAVSVLLDEANSQLMIRVQAAR